VASIARKVPSGGAARFRDGCRVHWQVVPSRKDAALGLAKSTHCRKADAESVLAAATEDRGKSGRHVRLDDPATYADYALVWLAAMEARNLKPETQLSYRRNVEVHIVPQLGALRILDTTAADVTAFTAYLLSVQPPRSGRPDGGRLTISYARQIRATCAQMIDHWAKDHPLPRDGDGNPVNPWRNAEKISGSRKPKRGKAWMPDEAQMDAWRAQLPPDMRAPFDVLVFTGNRGCEVWALQEQDITWRGKDPRAPLGPQLAALAELDGEAFAAAAAVLHTQRKMERDRTTGDVKNTLAERPLPLDRELTAALAAHFAVLPPRDGWLFYNIRPDHGPMIYDAEQAAQREADVARLWAQVLTPDQLAAAQAGAQHGGKLNAPGSNAAGAVAYVLAQGGRPVKTGEIAAHLGINSSNASACCCQLEEAGRLSRVGQRGGWVPGPKGHEMPAIRAAGQRVGWSREHIGRQLGLTASSVQKILARIPVQQGEPEYSLGADGRIHPRVRDDRPVAARGVRPAADGELRLWTGYSFRRWLGIAAERAGLPLPKGQKTHTTRHYRVGQLRGAGMTFEDIAEWIGDTPASAEEAYSQPSSQARADALAAIAAERARSTERTRPALRVVSAEE
jgi:integrase